MFRVSIAVILSALASLQTPLGRAQTPAKPYVLVIESAEVEAKKKSGGVEVDWDVAPAVTKLGLPDPQVIVVRRDAVLEMQTQEINTKINERYQEFAKKYANDSIKMADALERDPKSKSLNAELQKVLARYKRQTPAVDDTLKAVFRFESVRFDIGDKILVRVEDKDLVGFDLIGETEFAVTPEMVKTGSVDLKFGQVISLKLTFKKGR